MHTGDQVVIQRCGYISGKERRLLRAGILAHPCAVAVELNAAGIERGNRVDIFVVFAEILFKGIVTHRAIGRFAIFAEERVRELFTIVEIRETHIHAVEHVKRLVRRLGGVAQHGQHGLLTLAERVRTAAANVLDLVAIYRHIVLRHPLIQLFGIDGENLGAQKCGGGGKIHIELRGHGFHVLRSFIAVISGRIEHGV